ncbi:MAG: aspartate/glutamate racemase family protein [Thermoplasmata archaeon]|nr:MAG: aspartate/glutamate racemase family protein [Thermoplasmata archaeon]
MKAIGILGGLSPESTSHYYEHIIRTYFERFGDYNYPEVLIYSVNFQKYVEWQESGKWSAAAEDMIKIFSALHNAGADFGILATNTMHKVFETVQTGTPMPLISIMDATGKQIEVAGYKTVGLLGTIFTMRESFYKNDLGKRGIDVIVPKDDEQEYINRVIYEELTRGEVKKESRARFIEIVTNLNGEGAEGVILGCTEIPMIISEDDCGVTLFNTTKIHAEAALEYALKE